MGIRNKKISKFLSLEILWFHDYSNYLLVIEYTICLQDIWIKTAKSRQVNLQCLGPWKINMYIFISLMFVSVLSIQLLFLNFPYDFWSESVGDSSPPFFFKKRKKKWFIVCASQFFSLNFYILYAFYFKHTELAFN